MLSVCGKIVYVHQVESEFKNFSCHCYSYWQRSAYQRKKLVSVIAIPLNSLRAPRKQLQVAQIIRIFRYFLRKSNSPGAEVYKKESLKKESSFLPAFWYENINSRVVTHESAISSERSNESSSKKNWKNLCHYHSHWRQAIKGYKSNQIIRISDISFCHCYSYWQRSTYQRKTRFPHKKLVSVITISVSQLLKILKNRQGTPFDKKQRRLHDFPTESVWMLSVCGKIV